MERKKLFYGETYVCLYKKYVSDEQLFIVDVACGFFFLGFGRKIY